jgi:hypothetical protein
MKFRAACGQAEGNTGVDDRGHALRTGQKILPKKVGF